VSPAGGILRVGVERSASWATTTPAIAVKQGYATGLGGFVGRTYDISPDGQRFLMMKEDQPAGTGSPPELVVVQHFDEELKRLVPAN
jgi:hypothetical protein